MKTSLTAILFLMAQALYSEEVAETTKYARRHGARARIVLRCVDQDGQVVSNATVMSGVSLDGNPETTTQVNGKTDTNGCFVVYGKSNGELGYYCKRAGYYNTCETKHLDQFPGAFVSDGRWQPYGATNTVVLKRKVNPVAMCVRPNREGLTPLVPPSRNEYIGFDLEKGDWVNPHGKGIHADLNVKYEYEAGRIPVLHYRGAVFFAFTNKFDGAYVMKKDSFSVFGSGYQADTNAVYRQEIAFVYDRLSGTLKENSKFPASDYLVLRTRSKTDDKGNLLSANYAKIYGPISAGSGGIYMGFYFNPNENDPNLEADTTKNLLNPRDLGFPP